MDLQYFRSHIKSIMKEQGLTLSKLAGQADLSEDTLRSLIYGKSEDVKLSTIWKIADVLNCSIDYLVGHSKDINREKLIYNMQKLSSRSINAIDTLIQLELTATQNQSNDNHETIPVLVPTGNMKDGYYYDNVSFSTHDISNYPSSLKRYLTMGLLINTNAYAPTYFRNDILLLSTNKPIELDDIVLYQNQSGQLYLQRYTNMGLIPIDQSELIIDMNHIDEYAPLGIVLKVAKEFNIEQYR